MLLYLLTTKLYRHHFLVYTNSKINVPVFSDPRCQAASLLYWYLSSCFSTHIRTRTHAHICTRTSVAAAFQLRSLITEVSLTVVMNHEMIVKVGNTCESTHIRMIFYARLLAHVFLTNLQLLSRCLHDGREILKWFLIWLLWLRAKWSDSLNRWFVRAIAQEFLTPPPFKEKQNCWKFSSSSSSFSWKFEL